MAKKKDEEKKAALQARKDAKAGKAAQKRMAKQESSTMEGEVDDHLDNLLDMYKKTDVEVNTTIFETIPGFPVPRANATLTVSEDKQAHLYLFGGEFYDGVQNVVLDDLMRWDVQKKEWKQILTPAPKPAPRCAHSCVFYKNSLYVLGGELASADQYHHYKDLWKFDVNENKWQEIVTRNIGTIPTARSGHTAFVWKHYMVVFGGFYEALKDTRWFNDVCVLDLQTQTWMDIPHSKLATRPEARSACNFGICGDTAIIQGGYSKLKNPTTKSEAKVHADAWMLHLKPILQNKPPTWERLSIKNKTAASPMARSGTASITYKNRMLVFGGVVDEEQLHHKVESVFFNDLFAFDFERRKWFPLRAKLQQEGKSRRRRKLAIDDEQESETATIATEVEEDGDDLDDLEEGDESEIAKHGWDLDTLRSNMFAFMDGDGNIIYEKIEDDVIVSKVNECKIDNDEFEEEKEETKEGECENDDTFVFDHIPHPPISKTLVSSEVMVLNEKTGIPEAVIREEPLPRINACIVIRSNVLYIYGGLLEVGDREVTLDDCWSFDLRKRDKWECLWKGTMHRQVWRGAIHDDDDSYVSTGANGDDNSEGSSDDDDDDEINTDDAKTSNAVVLKTIGREMKEQSHNDISESNGKPDTNMVGGNPQNGETVADFFSRTAEYWSVPALKRLEQEEGYIIGSLSAKALKREGFSLAQQYFDAYKPTVNRQHDHNLHQKERPEEKKERKSVKQEKSDKKEKKGKKSRS